MLERALDAADELVALLSQDGFARPLRLARERIEQFGDVNGTIRLESATAEEIRCLGGLMGRRWRAPLPGQDIKALSLARIDSELQASRFGCSLPDALCLLDGTPLANHRQARAQQRASRDAIWAAAAEHPAARRPGTAAWLEMARRTGALARAAYQRDGAGLATCLDAADRLPAEPPEALAILAACLRGDAHALDLDRAAGQLLVSLLAWWEGSAGSLAGAAERRDLLQRNGILTDPISSAVTALNLPVTGGGLVARLSTAAAGHHLSLTLGNLAARELRFLPHDVCVCENPTILAEAERRFGSRAPTLVCTDGQFNTAALRLLEALAGAGCHIRVHADFDWGGLHIASRVIQTAGAVPWRYDALSYEAALRDVASTTLASRRPRDIEPILMPLADAVGTAGRAVHEEALVAELMTDLC